MDARGCNTKVVVSVNDLELDIKRRKEKISSLSSRIKRMDAVHPLYTDLTNDLQSEKDDLAIAQGNMNSLQTVMEDKTPTLIKRKNELIQDIEEMRNKAVASPDPDVRRRYTRAIQADLLLIDEVKVSILAEEAKRDSRILDEMSVRSTNRFGVTLDEHNFERSEQEIQIDASVKELNNKVRANYNIGNFDDVCFHKADEPPAKNRRIQDEDRQEEAIAESYQCRMFRANQRRGLRCSFTSPTKVLRNNHEARIHQRANFWHES